MDQSKSRKLLRALFTAAVVGVGAVGLAQAAEQLWVERPTLPIREGKGGAYKLVATASKGDQLTVIAREDNWVKVQFKGQEGYVLANALSARQIKRDSGLANAAAGGSDAGGIQTGAAGKGLTPEAEGYAKTKGMNPKLVEQMKERNSAVTPQEWDAFAREGNVGPGRKK